MLGWYLLQVKLPPTLFVWMNSNNISLSVAVLRDEMRHGTCSAEFKRRFFLFLALHWPTVSPASPSEESSNGSSLTCKAAFFWDSKCSSSEQDGPSSRLFLAGDPSLRSFSGIAPKNTNKTKHVSDWIDLNCRTKPRVMLEVRKERRVEGAPGIWILWIRTHHCFSIKNDTRYWWKVWCTPLLSQVFDRPTKCNELRHVMNVGDGIPFSEGRRVWSGCRFHIQLQTAGQSNCWWANYSENKASPVDRRTAEKSAAHFIWLKSWLRAHFGWEELHCFYIHTTWLQLMCVYLLQNNPNEGARKNCQCWRGQCQTYPFQKLE